MVKKYYKKWILHIPDQHQIKAYSQSVQLLICYQSSNRRSPGGEKVFHSLLFLKPWPPFASIHECPSSQSLETSDHIKWNRDMHGPAKIAMVGGGEGDAQK